MGDWTHTRLRPDQADNAKVHALLALCRPVGRDAMAAAYRDIIPHRLVYGSGLTQAARAAFGQALPIAAGAEAAARFARVGL